jgi:3-dehydroquinate synthase class II
LDGNWHLIPIENVITRLHFDALTDAPLKLQGETCAFMKPWDSNGWSKISFVELDRGAQEVVIPIYEKKRHFQTSRTATTAHRKKIERA